MRLRPWLLCSPTHERTHLIQPTTMPIAEVNRSQECFSFRFEHMILTSAQLAQHYGERHGVPDVPAGQIDLQTLPRAHGQHLIVGADLARQHLGVIRYQHQPPLRSSKYRAISANRAAAVATLLWALIQTEGYDLYSAQRSLGHSFC
jgi:hypothetical protein